MRRHELAGRENLLVAVCLRNPTRDTQLEGHIDGWLLDVARDGGATSTVRRAVLEAASRTIASRHDRDQISSFLARFALDGDRVAARALLRMTDLQVPCAEVAQNAIWGLGEPGWRCVIRSYGRRWRAAGRFDWSWIVHMAVDQLGRRRMLAALRDETDGRARLRPMAELVVSEERADRAGYPEVAVDASLDALERLVGARWGRVTGIDLRRWARHASASDLAEAWHRLVDETDARRLVRLLWVWRYRRPPSLHRRLFELARHENRLVRINAIGVLEHFRDSRVREFALRLLEESPIRAIESGALGLLERNARTEDAAIVNAALPPRASRETRNDWARGVKCIVDPPTRFREPRKSSAWTPLLFRALDVTPCRRCRSRLLGMLVERGAATEAMLREALFDADSDARKVARDALRRLRHARSLGGSRGRL